ncbi:MAG TPA: ABC transporter substrate-binding protein [Xanthobacteraceae bacterium]|nr:ABC transporter substrate-binding protein [Xanthobacteraceae bacterium]
MRSLKRLHHVLIGAALLALAVAPARAADPGLTDNEITIGLFGPLSGPLIGYGLDPLNAAKMLYEEANRQGGIQGRKIKLVVEDDKCTPNDLVAVVKKLTTVDKVFLLHGGSCTAAVAAAQDFVNREKIPMVMLNAAGDNAVFPPTPYVFGSFQATQRVYGSALASFAAQQLKAKRAAIIVHDDDYGNANLKTAKAVLERAGVQVVAEERIPPNISDITAPMLKVRAAKPDVILSGAYPAPAVLIAQKYAEYGMTDIPLLQATQGIPSPSTFAKNVGNPDALKNFYHTWSFTDIGDAAIHDKYIKLYKSYYPDREPTAFFVTGLPSAFMVIAALEKAGKELTRESFVKALEQTRVKPDVMAGELAFGPNRRDALRDVIVVRFDGVKQTVMPGVYTWNGTDGM